jgi:hypothetical protein
MVGVDVFVPSFPIATEKEIIGSVMNQLLSQISSLYEITG